MESEESRPWSVVLAGGEGRRLAPFISETLGLGAPKQYCAFTGGRTMLEHTLDRAALISGPERVVTVIDASHRDHASGAPGLVLEQPANRETAPGILLPLAHVTAAEPEAVVAVLPSDHFVRPNEAFAAEVRRAAVVAEAFPDSLVLLAARPDRPEEDYGWVEPGDWVVGTGLCARTVRRFVEKPGAREAARMNRAGWLWNTMIVVGRAGAFWSLARRTQPNLHGRFQALVDALCLGRGAEALPVIYEGMPSVDFSREMLERAPDALLAMPLSGRLFWSDWGRPERVLATLRWLDLPAARPRAEPFQAGARQQQPAGPPRSVEGQLSRP